MEIKAFLDRTLQAALVHFPDLFLVREEVDSAKGKYVYILDGDQGLTIEKCGKVSKSMLRAIEEDVEMSEKRSEFSFEIASPGATNPLLIPRQYNQHIGRDLELTLQTEETEPSQIQARLLEVGAEEIKVQTLIISKVKGRKNKLGLERVIPFNQIQESKIILSFK